MGKTNRKFLCLCDRRNSHNLTENANNLKYILGWVTELYNCSKKYFWLQFSFPTCTCNYTPAHCILCIDAFLTYGKVTFFSYWLWKCWKENNLLIEMFVSSSHSIYSQWLKEMLTKNRARPLQNVINFKQYVYIMLKIIVNSFMAHNKLFKCASNNIIKQQQKQTKPPQQITTNTDQ